MKMLNRLLAAFQYSLPSYLGYARPWSHPGNPRRFKAVRQITADHEAHVERLGTLILKRRGQIEAGRFPTRFTASGSGKSTIASAVIERLVERTY
jgi:hypothetical protein